MNLSKYRVRYELNERKASMCFITNNIFEDIIEIWLIFKNVGTRDFFSTYVCIDGKRNRQLLQTDWDEVRTSTVLDVRKRRNRVSYYRAFHERSRRVVEIIEEKYRFSINSGSIDNPSSPNSTIHSSECLLGLFSYIRTSKFSNFLANTL